MKHGYVSLLKGALLALSLTLCLPGISQGAPASDSSRPTIVQTAAPKAVTPPTAAKPATIDGLSIYGEVFRAFRDLHKDLRDPVARQKFIAEWEHKHDNDPTMNTEEGTDKAIYELIWSLGQRFDYYFPPEANKDATEKMRSIFAGVGMPVGQKGLAKAFRALKANNPKPTQADIEAIYKIADDRPMWVPEAPFENTPAAAAGIKKGDIITAVDGKAVNGKTLDEVVKLIRGNPKTSVKISVLRKGEFADQRLDLTMVRQNVQAMVVRSESLEAGITKVKMEHFESQFGDKEMAAALTKAAKGNAIILDLRGNPGGLMDQVLAIAQMFITEGKILDVQSREGDDLVTTTYSVTADKFVITKTSSNPKQPKLEKAFDRDYPVIVPADMPVIVLINNGSASASEILAGALQANHRAILVGDPSHGKGVGQNLVFIDHKNRNIHVTNFEFLPGGIAMDWVGVVPDVEVKLPDDADPVEDPSTDSQLIQAKTELLNIAVGNPAPVRSDAELAARRDELKKAHEADFAKEVDMRRKALADGFKAKDGQ